MVQFIEAKDFQQIDNAVVVKFLTGSAQVLADAGVVTLSDADKLRMDLDSLEFGSEHAGSILTQLVEQKAEFLTLLTSRYSHTSLCTNILRTTFRHCLSDTIALVSTLGEEMLDRAQLLFNRPFYVFVGGSCDRRTLFSSVLLDYAELIYRSAEDLQKVHDDLSTYAASDMAGTDSSDHELDERLAAALGFASVQETSLPYFLESRVQKSLVGSLELVAEMGQQIIKHIQLNQIKGDISKAGVYADSLSSELQQLRHFSFPDTVEIPVWDLRRLSFLTTVVELNATFHQFSKTFLEMIAGSAKQESALVNEIPQDIRRRLASSMISDGVSALKANTAAAALIQHCEQHKIAPSQVLGGELGGIDSNLTLNSLGVLQSLESSKNVVPSSTREKQKNIEKKERLMKLFHKKLSDLGVVGKALLLLLMIGGCGVKTAPKSALIDYRPRIDYRGDGSFKEPFFPQAPQVQPQQENGKDEQK